MEAVLVIGMVLWYLSGVAIFVWGWSARWDVTTEEVPLALFSGILGPVNYLCRAIIIPKWKVEEDNKRDIEHVRTMAKFNATINGYKLQLNKPYEPFEYKFEYFTNPGRHKVIMRTRNETKKRLQSGEIL